MKTLFNPAVNVVSLSCYGFDAPSLSGFLVFIALFLPFPFLAVQHPARDFPSLNLNKGESLSPSPK